MAVRVSVRRGGVEHPEVAVGHEVLRDHVNHTRLPGPEKGVGFHARLRPESPAQLEDIGARLPPL
eukprot:5774786-Alexandrium_andersonii.AAC.1